MATTKTTKPAPKKKVAAKKKKVTSYDAGPMEGVKQLAGKAMSYGKDMLKSGAKTYIDSEKRMLKNLKAGAKVAVPLLKKGAKALAKKITVKNVAKVLNSPKADKFRDAGPKYARGGVAKKMKKYQGDVGGSEVKTTTPSVTTAPTTVSRPAATTPTLTTPATSERAGLIEKMVAAGYNPRQINKALQGLDPTPKKRVDPNAVINAVGNLGTAAINTFGNRGNGGGAPSGGGGDPFQRDGGTVKRKRKLMKASEGVIVKMNGNQPVQKRAGSKGVRSGVNPKAKASKVTRGIVGGTSTAPKKALPKAGYGMMMKSKKG